MAIFRCHTLGLNFYKNTRMLIGSFSDVAHRKWYVYCLLEEIYRVIFVCNQGADSDDEWQALIDITETEEVDKMLAMLKNRSFAVKMHKRISTSAAKLKEGQLEGASKMRMALRLLTNLLTVKRHDVPALLYFHHWWRFAGDSGPILY